MTELKRIKLFNIHVNALTMDEVVQQIMRWLAENNRNCRFVVTPNVDHVVQLETNLALQAAYKDAALVVVDGKPVKWAASLLGKTVPCTVPGSDLVPAIFDAAEHSSTPLKVFLLGAMPGVADRAKARIENQWPQVQVVGTYSPNFGFEKNTEDCERICAMVNDSGAQLLLVGLGAPKQELWLHKHAPKLRVNGGLCIGATIDFLAGEKARAPVWMRKAGLEWAHRMFSEPKRLAKRYFVDAIVFPKLVYRAWQQKE